MKEGKAENDFRKDIMILKHEDAECLLTTRAVKEEYRAHTILYTSAEKMHMLYKNAHSKLVRNLTTHFTVAGFGRNLQ